MTPEQFMGCFGAMAEAPGGISELRSLARTLGVSGRLAAQNGQDGSAAELVAEIHADAEGCRRFGRGETAWSEQDEAPFTIPSSWCWVRLPELGAPIDGPVSDGPFGSKLKKSHYVDEPGFRVLRLENVGLGFFKGRGKSYISEGYYENLSTYHLEEHDLLVASLGKPPGRACLVPASALPAINKADCFRVRVHPRVEPRCVAIVLNSSYAIERALGLHRGDTRGRITLSHLRTTPIPVPPLAEQKRIVAKVDQLMAMLDDLEQRQEKRRAAAIHVSKASLDSLVNAEDPDQLARAWERVSKNFGVVAGGDAGARLRPLALELAVGGRLSEAHPTDGAAQDAIGAAERDTAWRVPERERRAKSDPSIEALAGQSVVPKGWIECRIEQVAQLINGRAYKQSEMLPAGTPIIRIQNLNGGDHWYYSDLELPPKQMCDTGDLLFAWSASFGPYIWTGGRAIFHYHIWKINLSPALDKDFFFHSLIQMTDRVRAQSHGLAMLHMTKAKMERWPIMLPPLAEQKRIVKKVETLMALIDQLEDRSTRLQQAASNLAIAATRTN